MGLLFLVKEGVLNFRRARLAAVITVVTVTLSLLLMGVFTVVIDNVSHMFQNFYKKVQLEVFIDPSLNPGQMETLKQEIIAIPAVDSIFYISPNQALQEFQKDFGEELITVLEANPLPPSFRVVLKSEYSRLDMVDDVVQQITAFPAVDEVLYQREIIRLMNHYFVIGVIVSFTLGLIILAIAILLIFNTIRLTIHARRNLIDIMKLVGATNFFIKGPFIVEGLLQGITGALVACFLLWLSGSIIQNIFLPEFNISVPLYVMIFSIGSLLGLIGSYISVNKYLKY